jgi:hypothetical protein
MTVQPGDVPLEAEVVPGEDGDVPAEAARRLRSGVFSSGLTVPDFAACLQMGLRPVGFVQGFCVMRWSWYAMGSQYLRGANPYGRGSGGQYNEMWNCPHGFVSAEHRRWGQNYEQPWVESAWSEGFGTAYRRMLEEASEVGAHGVIGVLDTSDRLVGADVIEFHLTGTAVVVDGADPPPGVWTTYLAGQRLAKLIEAGFMPVSIAAAMSSVRVWASCVTEYLISGQGYPYGYGSGGSDEIAQISSAHMAARKTVRSHVRAQIGADTLHGASLEVHEREVGEGDQEITSILKGNRVRRFKDFDPMTPPTPTVRLL